ncbi:MAG: hypothetical protein KGI69_00030 [Patescibacteria group bacterium]|nr:hypothetical protein [Patescibacteria group bacterium]
MNQQQPRPAPMKKALTLAAACVVVASAAFAVRPPEAHAQLGCSVSGAFSAIGGSLGIGSSGGGLSSVPVSDSQVQSNTSSIKNVQCTWNGIAWQLAHTVLHSLTGSVVNWINSGFQGNPSFITDPTGFALDTADQVTGSFLANSGPLQGLCSPWNVDIRLNLALQQAQPENDRYTCTLGTIINNAQNATINGYSMQGFLNGDFSQGGWQAFISMTTEPQNNPYGAYLQANSDLAQAIGLKQSAISQDLLQGNGFLSWQSCKDTPVPAGQAFNDPELGTQVYAGSGATTTTCTTQTPGSVINSSLVNVLGQSANELNLTSDINEVVSALFSQLLIKTLNGGLLSTSQPAAGSAGATQSVINQLSNDPAYQQNGAALQGEIVSEANTSLTAAQSAQSYYQQAVSALNSESGLYSSTQACLSNYVSQAAGAQNTRYTGTTLNTSYLQSLLQQINEPIANLNDQIAAAQAKLSASSDAVSAYQNMVLQLQSASSLQQANDLSQQFTAQQSAIDPTVLNVSTASAYLDTTNNWISKFEADRIPYSKACQNPYTSN